MVDASGVQMTEREYLLQWSVRHNEPAWLDPTFSNLCKACAAPGESRLDWLNKIAFLNLWPHNLGDSNDDKVTDAQLRDGAATLPERLADVAPRVVWIASMRVQRVPGVVEAIHAAGARLVRSVHPASWHGPVPKLAAAWAEAQKPEGRKVELDGWTKALEQQSEERRVDTRYHLPNDCRPTTVKQGIVRKDSDPHERRWRSLGYGGKTAPASTWRYWKKPGAKGEWIIAAPNGVAEFEQRQRDIYFRGEKILSGATQWSATWKALAYFYEYVAPTI